MDTVMIIMLLCLTVTDRLLSSDECNADQTYETIRTNTPANVIAGFTTKTSLMSCYRYCEDSEERLVSIYYKASTQKCGCFYQNAYRIIRVKTTSKENVQTPEGNVIFYIAPVSDQSCRQLHEGDWEADVLMLMRRVDIHAASDVTNTLLCDDEWTIVQRRVSGDVSFDRPWDDYAVGFGDVDGSFWIGLQLLHTITSLGSNQLHIHLESFTDGDTAIATYSTFGVGDAASNYALTISGYNGTAGDSLGATNGQEFSTNDQDHDSKPDGQCAVLYGGGWWFIWCHNGCLNCPYIDSSAVLNYGVGVTWETYKGFYESLKRVSMAVN